MVECRYVGNEVSNVGEREFDAIGQKATFSEQGYKEAVVGGAAFITEHDFKSVGFVESELEVYGPYGSRLDPPQSFSEKVMRAQQLYREQFSRLQSAECQADLALASE